LISLNVVENTDTLSITVIENPDASITLNNNDTICADDEVEMSLNQGYFYEWSTNETSESITTNQEGLYWATVFDSNFPGCYTQSDTIEINVIQLPVANFSFLNDDYEVSFSNLSNNATDYLWNFGDGNSSFDEDPTHTYISSDLFEAYLVATNSCGSDTLFQEIDLVYLFSDKVVKSMKIKLYPNPAQDYFTIEHNAENEMEIRCLLMDATGKIVKENRFGTSTHQQKVIDISDLPAGIYQVIINYHNNKQTVEKLVVVQ
jgi:hypothetical protein